MTYLRHDIDRLSGYAPDPTLILSGVPVTAWLHLNEAATASAVAAGGRSRRYPEPQPVSLRDAWARHCGVAPEGVLVGRGGDDIIDIVVRASCTPGAGRVVVSTPTFPMYAQWAMIHGVEVVNVPQLDDPGAGTFRYDTDAVLAAMVAAPVDVVFVCNPGNPTGQAVPASDIRRLAEAGQGRTLVLVDEAYHEFSGGASALDLGCENIVVLRTMSKAHALAGTRLGVALASAELIQGLAKVAAPFPLATAVSDLAQSALGDDALAATRTRVEQTVRDRERLAAALRSLPGVSTVYASLTNFVLLRTPRATELLEALRADGVVIRDLRRSPGFGDALRITVGTPTQTDTVLATCEQTLG